MPSAVTPFLPRPRQVATLDAPEMIAPGGEAFDSYGPALSAGELLLDYGFVDDCNEADVVALPAAALPGAVAPPNRALLAALGLAPEAAVMALTEVSIRASRSTWP